MPSKINLYPYFFRKLEALFLRGCCVLVHGHTRARGLSRDREIPFSFATKREQEGDGVLAQMTPLSCLTRRGWRHEVQNRLRACVTYQ
jgi:hypothetical protein